MIKQVGNFYRLDTLSSTYVIFINELCKPVLLYFGPRLKKDIDLTPLIPPSKVTSGRSVVFDPLLSPNLSLNDLPLEFTTPGQGDFHNPSLVITSKASNVFDFRFLSSSIKGASRLDSLPSPIGGEELILVLSDSALKTTLELHYLVYEESNVIGRYVVISTESEETLILNKAYSFNLSLPIKDYVVESYYGAWAGEFQKEISPLTHNVISISNDSGTSSKASNPLFFVKDKSATLDSGYVYGFNLMYSGSFKAEISKMPFGEVFVSQGVSPLQFDFNLDKSHPFISPLGVISFSKDGLNGVSSNFHSFVKNSLSPRGNADRPRPIAFNSWESCYFDFNESKLVGLAKKAKELGMELFVLDDGWFGNRNDDSTSLGDYFPNKKKLPHGVASLSNKIHKLGLSFGIWVEPEAISPDSELFKAHPEYAISDSVHSNSLGRNQLILDLTKEEVRDYLYSNLVSLIEEGDVDFIKWDQNRDFSNLPAGSSFLYRYYTGLYSLLSRLREKFPNLWMENCAAGGARNDLGMMNYFDTCWASDNTDAFDRAVIVSNMAKGYPSSVLANHVSAKTNHQALRKTPLSSKFAVSFPGVLGYELNLNDLDPVDLEEIKNQISLYKAHRRLAQFGSRKLKREAESGFIEIELSLDKEGAVVITQGAKPILPPNLILSFASSKEEKTYHVYVKKEKIDYHAFGSLINSATPIHVKEDGILVNALSRKGGVDNEKFDIRVNGSILKEGVPLGEPWRATGYNEFTRIQLDFQSRLYLIEEDERAK